VPQNRSTAAKRLTAVVERGRISLIYHKTILLSRDIRTPVKRYFVLFDGRICLCYTNIYVIQQIHCVSGKGGFFLKKILCAACSLCLCAAMSGCFLLPVEEEAPKIALTQEEEDAFVFVQAVPGTVCKTFTCRAIFEPTAAESYSFPVTNIPIAEIFVKLGDVVTEGQLLAELDCTDLRQRLDSARFRQSQYSLQLSELDSSFALQAEGIADPDVLAAAQSGYETQRQILLLQLSAEAGRIGELEADIRERQIHSEMDGVVTFLNYAGIGDVIAANTAMVIVSDTSTSSFVITGADTEMFRVGDRVTMRVNQETIEGTVAEDMAIIGTEDPERVFLVPDGEREYSADTRAEVTKVMDLREEVLSLDFDAIRVRDGQAFVYVLDENGLQVMQDVTVGLVGDDTVEILSGLESGDLVILK